MFLLAKKIEVCRIKYIVTVFTKVASIHQNQTLPTDAQQIREPIIFRQGIELRTKLSKH